MPKSVSQTPTELVSAMLAAQRLELVENEEGTRAGSDPECLHRMRVATRRARATLRVTRGAIQAERAESLREELAWLGGVLGAVRDLDVLTVHLKAESEALEPAERAALKPLFSRLAAERRKPRSALTRALNGKRYARLLDDLEAVSAAPLAVNGRVKLDALAGKEFGRLAKSMRALGGEPSDDELHRVRILGKRARYAAELAGPLKAKPSAEFVKRAKAFQDVIGDHQDAVVAEEKLRALTADADTAEAFAAGRLVERERKRRSAARAKVPQAWKELERAGLRTWH